MAATNLNIRTDKAIKEQAEQIFNELGLNMTTAINLFLRTAIREHGIPFELKLDVPNDTTAAAIEEGRNLLADPSAPRYSSMEALNKKMAEYAWAILHGRPHFHISLIVDVSPYCDCHAENDAPVVPNIGMLASFDPVALDQACADLVNAAPVMANSLLDDHLKADPEGCQGHDHFHNLTPESEWKTCLAHAEKLGMGTRAYELVTVK